MSTATSEQTQDECYIIEAENRCDLFHHCNVIIQTTCSLLKEINNIFVSITCEKVRQA